MRHAKAVAQGRTKTSKDRLPARIATTMLHRIPGAIASPTAPAIWAILRPTTLLCVRNVRKAHTRICREQSHVKFVQEESIWIPLARLLSRRAKIARFIRRPQRGVAAYRTVHVMQDFRYQHLGFWWILIRRPILVAFPVHQELTKCQMERPRVMCVKQENTRELRVSERALLVPQIPHPESGAACRQNVPVMWATQEFPRLAEHARRTLIKTLQDLPSA